VKPPYKLEDPPWGDIDGERKSVDGTRVSTIEEDDVAEWLAMGSGDRIRASGADKRPPGWKPPDPPP